MPQRTPCGCWEAPCQEVEGALSSQAASSRAWFERARRRGAHGSAQARTLLRLLPQPRGAEFILGMKANLQTSANETLNFGFSFLTILKTCLSRQTSPRWFSAPLSFPTAAASCLAWVSGLGRRKSSRRSRAETPSIRQETCRGILIRCSFHASTFCSRVCKLALNRIYY